MALGIGLTITNTRAVLEALIGTAVRLRAHAEVSRGIEEGQRSTPPSIAAAWAGCRGSSLLIGTYFAMTVYYAIANENYITVPFLVLFVLGYWYTGLMSLLQGRFSGLSLSAETAR